MTRHRSPTLTATLAICAALCGTPGAAAEGYRDAPIVVSAADSVPAEWLQGTNYRVVSQASNNGVFNRYTLQTDYGEEVIESNVALAARIQELRALEVMEAMKRTTVMKDALVAGVQAPLKGAAALVTSPVNTTVSIARGTGRFFGNLGHSLFSGDPDQDNALKVILGYDAAKRSLAYELGIDPYTSYEPAMDRLGEIARAAVAGGIAPGAALAAVNFRGSTLVQASATADGMRQLVRDNPPSTLRSINRKKLAAMGIDKELSELFLDNYHFNPLEETLLVGILEAMPEAAGRSVLLTNAALVGSEASARFNRVIAQMMLAFYEQVDSEVTIVDAGGAVGLRRGDGTLILMAPVDYLFWTEAVAANLAVMDRELSQGTAYSRKEIWLTGRAGPQARAGFQAAGWLIREETHTVLGADPAAEEG